MPSDGEFAVRTRGLADLTRSLGKISKEYRKDVVGELRKIGKKVRADAVPLTPVLTGELRRSLKVGATNKGTRIYSTLPQAPVIEYGGTIRPRGVPIVFPRRQMVGRAIQKDAGNIEEQLGDLLDRIAADEGW